MATVTLLRNGKPTQVEVPTSFNTEDDCRIFLSYWKAQGATAWDTRVVGPFVEAFNSGTISLEEVVTLANGEIIAVKEDVGRHNALDKLIGFVLKQNLLDNSSQFLTCSGRLNFDLVQKALMANIGVLIGVGAPTSLAIDLANKFDMTLVGFVKEDSFNIYSNKERIIIKA